MRALHHALPETDDVSIGQLGMHALSARELERVAEWIGLAPLMRPKSAEELANSRVAVLRRGTLIRAFATLSPLPLAGSVTLLGSVIANPEISDRGRARSLVAHIVARTDTQLFAVSRCPKFIGIARHVGFEAYGVDDLEGMVAEMARLATPDLSGKTFLYRPAAKTDRATSGR